MSKILNNKILNNKILNTIEEIRALIPLTTVGTTTVKDFIKAVEDCSLYSYDFYRMYINILQYTGIPMLGGYELTGINILGVNSTSITKAKYWIEIVDYNTVEPTEMLHIIGGLQGEIDEEYQST